MPETGRHRPLFFAEAAPGLLFGGTVAAWLLNIALPGQPWWPIPLLVGSWLLYLASGAGLFARHKGLTVALLLFLLTAGLAVWSAFNTALAWQKWRAILLAVAVFYAVAAQPKRRVRLLLGLLIVAGIYLATHYLLAGDWHVMPAKIGLVTRLGQGWMALRPDLGLRAVHPNVVGGILAFILPIVIGLGGDFWRRGERVGLLLMGLIGVFLVAVLLITTSRGAWYALALGLITWPLWERRRLTRGQWGWSVALVVVGVTVLAGSLLWFEYTSGGGGATPYLPGTERIGHKLTLFRDTLFFVAVFPFIGGGLDTFAGLYAHYFMVEPNFIVSHSHNVWLNVAVEQGQFGLGALVAIYLLVGRRVYGGRSDMPASEGGASLLPGALKATGVVFCAHSLVDIVTPDGGLLLLMILAGLALLIFAPPKAFGVDRRFAAVLGVTMLLLLSLGWGRVMASWSANLGAISLAKVELADWPSGQWQAGRPVAELADAQANFVAALGYNPDQMAAHYGLGNIALLEQDFNAAIAHYEVALAAAPNHRGIHKRLGYAYIWGDELASALPLLAVLPEAETELGIYSWWWGIQGRDDLAALAVEAATELHE